MVPEPQGIYIEPTNICTLKCAGCARTDFITRWPQAWHNHSVNVQEVMQFLDCDLQGRQVLLSGNYGDPIYHPDFADLVRALKHRGSYIKITTNGSYRTLDWWTELAECLDQHDTVIFSIDGVPGNFTQYRQNADWSSIKTGIDVCVASPARTVWKYIPFSFNQDTISQAQELSQHLGFDDFFLDPSKRFDDPATQAIQPMADLVNPEFTHRMVWKDRSAGTVDPRCQSGKEHFITADGYYTPCCYVADHRWLYKTSWGRQRDRYSIATTTLSQILNRSDVVEFYRTLEDQSVCQFSCPG
jgi:hypothetical protein